MIDTLHQFDRAQFSKDVVAGIVVGVVALPLAIAFAIASGVSPEKGLITAVIAGFIISAFGGSRVQIGGPTGAFIVIVYGIVQQHGVNGLLVSTLLAGIMLIVMGFARLGSVIKFIPHPLIVGFTAGIAVIIFSSQIKDLFGLPIQDVPAGFIDKWSLYFGHFSSVSIWSLLIATGTISLIVVFNRLKWVVPGSLVSIFLFTILVQLFQLPVETIGSKFGDIPSSIPQPMVPDLNWDLLQASIKPAFTIALLAGIESLLSAVVADGVIGGNHRSNMELVAQGGANIASALFGGIPATGAIARTMTNIRSGGRTPVAGIVHSVVLLVIMLAAAQWAVFIPMSCLAGILVVVAFNMSEYHTFYEVVRGNRGDAAVLLTTFFLTVLFDLTLALEVGMILAVFLFFRTMVQISNVKSLFAEEESDARDIAEGAEVPRDVMVFQLSGPLFFGAAYKFKDTIRALKIKPRVIILRMNHVPVIDGTGLRMIGDVLNMCNSDKIRLIVSEVQPQVAAELKRSRLLFKIGKRYVTPDFGTALARTTPQVHLS